MTFYIFTNYCSYNCFSISSSDGQASKEIQSIHIALVCSRSQEKVNLNRRGEHLMKFSEGEGLVNVWIAEITQKGNLAQNGFRDPIHNRLRPIKGGQFRLINFASHFICV